MVEASDAIAVAVPKGTCIPFQFGKAFKSVIFKFTSCSSSNSKHKQHLRLPGKNDPNIEDSPSSIVFESTNGNKESLLRKEDSLKRIHSCRYQSNRFQDHYYDTAGFSCLSRNGSRSNNTSPFSRDKGSSRAFSGQLSTMRSQRSSTPIMFSSSTGIIKPPALEKSLECTLEELCYGCTKKINITRDVVRNTGETVQEEEELTINVKPGWKKGTKITFEGKGDQRLGMQPSDVTFIIAEKKHPLFRRDGDDLELSIEIPLVKALTGCNLTVPLLGGTKMQLKIDDIVHPGYETVVKGQGMPIPNSKQSERGNLRVVFLVAFPKDLKDERRVDAGMILQGSS